jgi:1-deoxy-D-xylulose-5-phosphate reductoisomerase
VALRGVVGSLPRRVAVLGSTGSIGRNTLEVISAFPQHLQAYGLVAHSSVELLLEQCQQFRPRVAVLTDPAISGQVDPSRFPTETELRFGIDAACTLVREAEVDTVLSAIVGAAGLHATWAALDAGKRVALANKESLVVGGSLVMELARLRQAEILPVDSEHSAIAQALGGHTAEDVLKVVLTASGGPFRGKPATELEDARPADALKHPTWVMGRKITIDSATLMNKALEVIEARWLFDLSAEQLDVIVHPGSMVHSFVEFRDGSVMAQLSPPDMKLPIQLALLHPMRLSGPATKLDWSTLTELRFEQPDHATFPALQLGFRVARDGGTSGATLNAANEVAVQRFLDGEIGFLDITRLCQSILDHHDFEPHPTLERLLSLDGWARQEAGRWTPRRTLTNR